MEVAARVEIPRSRPRPYAGEDRRSRTPSSPAPPRGREVALVAAALTAAALLPTLGVWMTGDGWARGLAAARDLAAMTAAGAGVASLVRWRLLGSASAGWLGAAWLVGALTILPGAIGSPEGGLTPLAAVLPVDRVVVWVMVAYLMWRAVGAPPVAAGLRPLRILAVAVVASEGAMAGFQALVTHGASAPLSPAAGGILEGVTAAALLAVALRAALSPRSQRQLFPWIAPVALLLCAGEATRWLLIAWSDRFAFVASTFTLMGLMVALSYSVIELQQDLRSQDRRALGLALDLSSANARLDRESSRLAERRHELRNALAAIRCTDGTLRDYGDTLGPRTRQTLADAVTCELARLEQLIEPAAATSFHAFELGDCLASVVAGETALGSSVRLQVGALRAEGDPDKLAEVVQNLLINARRYAAGTEVVIAGAEAGGRIQVFVEDGGPGIPASERLAVFARGNRGSTSAGTPGSGLGLFVASEMMAEMGGSLRLADRGRRGARFVIELASPGPDASSRMEPGGTVATS